VLRGSSRSAPKLNEARGSPPHLGHGTLRNAKPAVKIRFQKSSDFLTSSGRYPQLLLLIEKKFASGGGCFVGLTTEQSLDEVFRVEFPQVFRALT
jgi:hypothetical protein